jgi:Domain of unknown function (DUF4279)
MSGTAETSKTRSVQPYEYSISFRFRHPSMDPAEISRELGIEPRRMWKAGEQRATPAGRPLAGVYPHSYWCTKLCSLVDADDELLPEALVRLLDEFRVRKPFLLRMRREGGSAEFYVGVHGPASFGFEFAPELLADLAGLGITLSLEIYPLPQNS